MADGLIHGWLGLYSIEHDLEFYPNATLLLDTENSFQPDAILCSKPRKAGESGSMTKAIFVVPRS